MKQIKLAAGESVAKIYSYGHISSGRKKNTIENSLIVTNKRVIYQSLGNKTVSRKEIPVEAAEYIDTKYTTQRVGIWFTVFSFLIGAALLALGLDFLKLEFISSYGLKLPLIVAGGVLIALALFGVIRLTCHRRRGAVEVIISGRLMENELLSFGVSNLKVRQKQAERLRIKVDKSVAVDMVNELGALLLNIRAANSQKNP